MMYYHYHFQLQQPPLISSGSSAHKGTKSNMSHRPSYKMSEYDGSVADPSGILSPSLSMSGSTTVTPITPMTPLTTPRTPLQILMMGKQNVLDGLRGGPYRRSTSIPSGGGGGGQNHNNNMPSSLQDYNIEEEDEQYREKQLLALQLFANFLNTAETTLNDITDRENSGHQVLGPGIVRVCNDLADEIEGVAKALDKEHRQATEHLQQVMSDHELCLIEEGGDTNIDNNDEFDEKKISDEDATNQTALAMSNLAKSESLASFQSSHEEFITTLSTTHTLLIDMAAALRGVTQQEAQELGEVALEVARMFVWSLGVVHSNMLQMTVQNEHQVFHSSTSLEQVDKNGEDQDDERDNNNDETKQKTGGGATKHRVTWVNDNHNMGLGPVVEILGEEEKKDDQGAKKSSPSILQRMFGAKTALPPSNNRNAPPGTPPKAKSQLRYTPQLSPIASSPTKGSSPTSTNIVITRQSGGERIRVLWPPLLPAVADASVHCAHSAQEHPLPALAVGLTCGPAMIATAAIAGPPLLVADWAIQSSYDALSEHTPVIENVEKGAANALQVARLAILCSKLVVKQGLLVGESQIERRGGVGKMCSDAVGGAVDMALHPIETTGVAIEGLFWMGGAVRDAVGFISESVSHQADIHE